MSRRQGSKDAHGRFSSVPQMQARAAKLAAMIAKFTDQANRQHYFKPSVNFKKLTDAHDHLHELSTKKIDQ